MHRSGTSALAGALSALGFHMGDALLPAVAEVNDRGFWENSVVVDIHDRLLSELRRSWDDFRPLPEGWLQLPEIAGYREEIMGVMREDYLKRPLWGIKDPRMCLLLPLWLEVLEAVEIPSFFVHIHRAPNAVARSLERRDGFAPVKSGLLWLQHNLLAEKATRGRPRLFVNYETMLAEPSRVAERLVRAIDENLGTKVDGNIDGFAGFVDPELRRQAGGARQGVGEFGVYTPVIEEMHRCLMKACDTDRQNLSSEFDRVGRSYEKIVASFDPLLIAHIEDLQARVAELRRSVDQLLGSKSWRITQPLRNLWQLARKFGRQA